MSKWFAMGFVFVIEIHVNAGETHFFALISMKTLNYIFCTLFSALDILASTHRVDAVKIEVLAICNEDVWKCEKSKDFPWSVSISNLLQSWPQKCKGWWEGELCWKFNSSITSINTTRCANSASMDVRREPPVSAVHTTGNTSSTNSISNSFANSVIMDVRRKSLVVATAN